MRILLLEGCGARRRGLQSFSISVLLRDPSRRAGVSLEPRPLVAGVRPQAVRLYYPLCPYSTGARYDRRAVPSRWRHLDFGAARVEPACSRLRLQCPAHGVVTEWAPFARYRSAFTQDCEAALVLTISNTGRSSDSR
jgi:transposase